MGSERMLWRATSLQALAVALSVAVLPAVAHATVQDTAQVKDTTQKKFKDYDKVVTADAKSYPGLFKIHWVGDKMFFEIPPQELGKEQLFVGRAVRGQGSLYGRDLIRWERRGDRIYIHKYAFGPIADTSSAISKRVLEMQDLGLVHGFNIETFGPDSAPVIEVTQLFTTGLPGFVAVQGLAPDRTFLERVYAFSDNFAIEATQTGTGQGGQPNTVVARWTWLRLPEQPMKPRLADARLGIFADQVVDYSRAEHKSVKREYVQRFRLEKQNPSAELSDPIKPIIFWIDPATPSWLVPWVKKGAAAWLPAFEQAGFTNAIFAKEAPSPSEDPNWSFYDARHSTITWEASETENAFGGPSITDPRTGEIIHASVSMMHNVMNLLWRWYFTQVAPLDPRAQTMQFPDSLMGRLVEYVVSHEIGHALAFNHNMKSSAMYPVDSLRSADFLRRMNGHVATLMDYSRFNYVAQPEDSIPVELLVPQVGPYDRFVVMWQNKPIPEARTPDEEKPILDAWARQQDSIPWFRFETRSDGWGVDPHALTEAVGDADAVRASQLGLKNLKRVMKMILPVAERPGENYDAVKDLYESAVQQFSTYMGHVSTIVGGVTSQEKYGTGARFTPETKARQRAAVAFLVENAFNTPTFLVDSAISRRIEPSGMISRITGAQSSVLQSLLESSRLNRMVEFEATSSNPSNVYSVSDLLGDIRKGVWGELTASNTKTDIYRRALQRSYVDAMAQQVKPADNANASPWMRQEGPTDVRAMLRGELVDLGKAVDAALGRTTDPSTRLHLNDIKLRIEDALRPGK